MLSLALALLVLAVACAVVLAGPLTARPTEPVLAFVTTDAEAAATTEAWRGAALDAHGRVKRLRHGIFSALDSYDTREREAILRDALADTWRPDPVRIDL